MTRLRLTFHTPLFSKGSYEDRPEIRPPSIRGQLHGWFRALGGKAPEENAIFGSVHGRPIVASKVVVRVANPHDGNGGVAQTAEIPTLPHKRGGQASPKWAYKAGTTFDLLLSERLGGLNNSRETFQRALEAWLLMGTLGLRSTRAAGSFSWTVVDPGSLAIESPTTTFEDYKARCAALVQGAPLRFFLLPDSYQTAEAARIDVSDTLGGRDDPQGDSDLARLNHPLGRVFGGRKTSPLRFRIIRLESGFHIVAIWDDRSEVTGNRSSDFESIVRLLADRDKPIGISMKAFIS